MIHSIPHTDARWDQVHRGEAPGSVSSRRSLRRSSVAFVSLLSLLLLLSASGCRHGSMSMRPVFSGPSTGAFPSTSTSVTTGSFYRVTPSAPASGAGASADEPILSPSSAKASSGTSKSDPSFLEPATPQGDTPSAASSPPELPPEVPSPPGDVELSPSRVDVPRATPKPKPNPATAPAPGTGPNKNAPAGEPPLNLPRDDAGATNGNLRPPTASWRTPDDPDRVRRVMVSRPLY